MSVLRPHFVSTLHSNHRSLPIASSDQNWQSAATILKRVVQASTGPRLTNTQSRMEESCMTDNLLCAPTYSAIEWSDSTKCHRDLDPEACY